MYKAVERLIQQDTFSRGRRLLPSHKTAVNGWYPVQKESNVFDNGTGYSHLLCKHGQIALCIARSRHGPVYLAIRINVGCLNSRVYAHDGLFAMLPITAFGDIATTAVERGGNGFEVHGYGDGNEGRLGRGCCANKDWETARL